jgi:hypothetical protein
VIAAVNGAAAGAGLSLACACDLRIASDQATFVPAFVNIGLIPDSGGTFFVTRLVGQARAFEWLCSGRRLTAGRGATVGRRVRGRRGRRPRGPRRRGREPARRPTDPRDRDDEAAARPGRYRDAGRPARVGGSAPDGLPRRRRTSARASLRSWKSARRTSTDAEAPLGSPHGSRPGR